MKKIFTWATALTMSLSLFSCDKENKDISSAPSDKQEQVEIEENNGPKKTYVASSQVGAFSVRALDDVEVDPDDLRATLIKKGYHKPTLKVSKAEFDKYNIPAYWFIFGEGESKVGRITKKANRLSDYPAQNNEPTENTIVIKNDVDKTKFKYYAQVDENFDVKNKFAVLALDGDLSGNYLEFSWNKDPNKKLVGVMKDGEVDGRHIPIMTDILPFDKVFNSDKPVHFKPRGILIGLNIINNICDDVKLENINTHYSYTKTNALWFYGKFDMQTTMDKTDLSSMSSVGITEGKKAKFIEKESSLYSYFYNGDTKYYDLIGLGDLPITPEIKKSAPTFYVWGFPNSNNTDGILRFTICYKNIRTNKSAQKDFAIPVPKDGFQEGYAYQLPVLLNDQDIDYEGVVSTWETPLDYLSELPGVNKAGDALVPHHRLPRYKEYEYRCPSEIGRFTWYKAKALFSKPFLANYTFPNDAQWKSISPNIPQYYHFDRPINKTTITEIGVQIGNTTIQDYQSEIMAIDEGGLENTFYALRFKGTEWESAWQYYVMPHSKFYSSPSTRKIIIVKCVLTKYLSNISSVEDIADPKNFKKNVTIRAFPLYVDGFARTFNWSSSDIKGSSEDRHYTFGGSISDLCHGGIRWDPLAKFTVRPFYKVLPKK